MTSGGRGVTRDLRSYSLFFRRWMSSSQFQCRRGVINDTKVRIGANTSRTARRRGRGPRRGFRQHGLEMDELRESRKSAGEVAPVWVDGAPAGLGGLDENAIATPAALEPGRLVIRCRSRTVRKVVPPSNTASKADQIGVLVRIVSHGTNEPARCSGHTGVPRVTHSPFAQLIEASTCLGSGSALEGSVDCGADNTDLFGELGGGVLACGVQLDEVRLLLGLEFGLFAGQEGNPQS
jgi:hypothetical protein